MFLMISRGAYIYFLTFIFLITPALAQDETSDIQWFESFFKPQSKNTEQRLSASNAALEQATENDDVAAQAKALNEIALIYFTDHHNSEKAMEFLIRALTLEEGMDIKQQQIFTYLGISQIFFDAGDYNKCAHFLEQALQVNESLKNAEVLAFTLNKLGNVNAMRGRTEDAF